MDNNYHPDKTTYYAQHSSEVSSFVCIDHAARSVRIEQLRNGEWWGTGFGDKPVSGIPREPVLNLTNFAESISGIPWTALSTGDATGAGSIRGYKIILGEVQILDDKDKVCKEWFTNLGCTVC